MWEYKNRDTIENSSYYSKDDKTLYFELNKSVPVINEIKIKSSTFIPKQLGWNDDTRELGIDVRGMLVR